MDIQVALPVVSNQLNLKRYFDVKQTEIWYDITYTIQTYKDNKFSLQINVIKEDGEFPSKSIYFFNSITSIHQSYLGNNEYSLEINFMTLNHVSIYKYSRFSSKHADALHQFLIDNIM